MIGLYKEKKMEEGILKFNYSVCTKMKYRFISSVCMHETDHYKIFICLNKLFVIFNLPSGEMLLYIRNIILPDAYSVWKEIWYIVHCLPLKLNIDY